MTHAEALQKLESWLLVPVDYEGILPALATIKGSDEYDSYVHRVADTEFTSCQKIDRDVCEFLTKGSDKVERKKDLESKLASLSGKKVSLDMNKAADVLDDLEREKFGKTDDELKCEEEKARYEAYVDGYMTGSKNALLRRNNAGTSLAPCCSRCGSQYEVRQVYEEMGCGTIGLTVLLAFIFFPLALIPILSRKKVERYYCPHCNCYKDK